jgi:hypothetical protein
MMKLRRLLIIFNVLLAIAACNKTEDYDTKDTSNPLSLKEASVIYCNEGNFFSSYHNSPTGISSLGWIFIRNNETLLNLYLKPDIGFQNLTDNIDIGFYTGPLPTSKPDPNSLHYHYTTGAIPSDLGTEINFQLEKIFIENIGITSSVRCGEEIYIVVHYDALDESGNPLDIWTGNMKIEEGSAENYWWYKYIAYTPACCITCEYETAWGGNSAGYGRAWWYYFNTSIGSPQNIYAGQNKLIGTVTYDAISGTLAIILTNGYELDLKPDTYAVKVQGYNSIPLTRPTPGLFQYKGNSLTVVVNPYQFYAIHLDVRICK